MSRAIHDPLGELHKNIGFENFDRKWILNESNSSENSNQGLRVAVFQNDDTKDTIIAFHSTPSKSHLPLLADGEILREAGWPAVTGQGEQLVEMQRAGLKATGLLADEWHPQFALALSEAKRIKEQYEAEGYSVSVTGHGAGGSARSWLVTPWTCQAMPLILWAPRTSLNRVATHSGAVRTTLICRKELKTASSFADTANSTRGTAPSPTTNSMPARHPT